MKKYFLPIALLIVLLLVYFFDLTKYFTFETLKEHHTMLKEFYKNSPQLFALSFFTLYVACATFYLPGIAIFDIASSSIMNFYVAVIINSFAGAIGSTGALLLSRYVLRDLVKKIFPGRYEKINAGLIKGGDMYLLTMRLIPLFPFVVVNAIMGLTSYSVFRYYIVSQIGMLPANIIIARIGASLKEIEEPSQILTPSLFILLLLLALLPWIAKIFLKKYTFNK